MVKAIVKVGVLSAKATIFCHYFWLNIFSEMFIAMAVQANGASLWVVWRKRWKITKQREIHSVQSIVERFNRALVERLFAHKYAVEMLLPSGQWSTAWVKRLSNVVAALNNEVTSLIEKRNPPLQSKRRLSPQNPLQNVPDLFGWAKNSSPFVNVRYLYQPGDLEGGTCRATDPVSCFSRAVKIIDVRHKDCVHEK